jgi:hypothetical protein
LTEQFD